MNNSETPVDQEQPLSEGRGVHVDTRDGDLKLPEPVAALPGERYAKPTMPPPFNPYGPPYTWPRYYPGTGPQWEQWQGQPRFSYPRRRSHWPWIVLTFVLLFMLLIGGTVFALLIAGYNSTGYAQSITETQHYTVSANPTLVLNNDTGSIHVRTAPSQNEVIIQATRHTGSWGNLNDLKVNYTQNTEANTVTVNVDRLSNFNFFTSASVEFTITLPSTAALQLKTNTGSIDVSGVSGQMVLTSNTGSISASDGRLVGNSELITNTGSVTFAGAIDPKGTYRFETNTGSVNVTLPSDSVFHVDASTDTGSINSNFPGVTVQHRQFTGADVHSDVGSAPQATINMKTNTGSINLDER
jgi:hypothetical protein